MLVRRALDSLLRPVVAISTGKVAIRGAFSLLLYNLKWEIVSCEMRFDRAL